MIAPFLLCLSLLVHSVSSFQQSGFQLDIPSTTTFASTSITSQQRRQHALQAPNTLLLSPAASNMESFPMDRSGPMLFSSSPSSKQPSSETRLSRWIPRKQPPSPARTSQTNDISSVGSLEFVAAWTTRLNAAYDVLFVLLQQWTSRVSSSTTAAMSPFVSISSADLINHTAILWSKALRVMMNSWWIFPMVLALVPIHCAVFEGSCAAMPEWWQVVRMDAIRTSKGASLVISGFLGSNIAYFLSGGFLMNRFSPLGRANNNNTKRAISWKPTKFSWLGVWILTAGLVSTVFHSVQALGSYPIAESLCYIDHGVAISASAYYLDTCGRPSKKVLAIGLTGLAALVFTWPSYAFLHSSWHFLSAGAATLWAVEGAANHSSKAELGP